MTTMRKVDRASMMLQVVQLDSLGVHQPPATAGEIIPQALHWRLQATEDDTLAHPPHQVDMTEGYLVDPLRIREAIAGDPREDRQPTQAYMTMVFSNQTTVLLTLLTENRHLQR